MPTTLIQKAVGAVKDKQSIYRCRLSRKTGSRHPNLEAAIIKATSHDESFIDYKNAQRVFEYIRTCPTFLRPFFWAVTKRIEKTRSWVVALKGLMLVHGVFCLKISAVRNVGRLPFDLTNFHDQYSKPSRAWGFSSFVRAYYVFLDHRSTFMSYDVDGEDEEERLSEACPPRMHRLQTLLDLLLQIRPYGNNMEVGLILEAIDCVVLEIFDVYSEICNGIASILTKIFSMGPNEAAATLQILHKATSQNVQLSAYFDFCRNLGVVNANELPPVKQIPEQDIRDLEGIISRISGKQNSGSSNWETVGPSERRFDQGEEKDSRKSSGTIITENWVVFNDEMEAGNVKEDDGFGERRRRRELEVGRRWKSNGFLNLQQIPKTQMLLKYHSIGEPENIIDI